MSYRIGRDESVRRGVRRIAHGQIAKARDDVRKDDPREAVHEVRKRCKKLRALLRLVRVGMEDTYQRENAQLRDAARRLSELRDATSLLECFDALMERFDGEVDVDRHAPVRARLVERREKLEASRDVGARLERMDEALDRVRTRVDDWDFDGDAIRVVGRSVKKTYGRVRRAMRRSRRDPSGENLHEWRKRVKYGRFHMRLLSSAFDPVLPALRDAGDTLSAWLGDHHDLVVLRATLLDESEGFGPASGLGGLLEPVDARRLELRAASMPLGARLHADPPGRFRKRIERYLRAWEQEKGIERALPETPGSS